MSTVLIVEDESPVAEALVGVLEDEGYRAVTASNGIEGLERLAAEHVDLVLCDLMLPQLDGMGLCRRMHEEPAYIDIPVVVMSAAITTPKRSDCGYAAFLAKPFNIEDLVDTVATVLEETARG